MTDIKSLILKNFDLLIKIEQAKGREWPERSFKKAYHLIRTASKFRIDSKTNKVVLTFEDGNTKELGYSSSEVFREIVTNGYSTRVRNEIHLLKKEEPKETDLYRVQGLGEVKVAELLKAGIDSIKKLSSLNLRVGQMIPGTKVKYTSQINSGLMTSLVVTGDRIDREKAELIVNFLRTKFVQEYPDLEFVVLGSYRRMKPTIGDIDIAIFHDKEVPGVLDYMKKLLEFIFVDGESKISGSIMGTQVDIRLIESKCRGAHILHGTGSRDFNVIVRRRANELGYTLNEYCLTELKTGTQFYFDTEEEIFSKLGMSYVKPEDR